MMWICKRGIHRHSFPPSPIKFKLFLWWREKVGLCVGMFLFLFYTVLYLLQEKFSIMRASKAAALPIPFIPCILSPKSSCKWKSQTPQDAIPHYLIIATIYMFAFLILYVQESNQIVFCWKERIGCCTKRHVHPSLSRRGRASLGRLRRRGNNYAVN